MLRILLINAIFGRGYGGSGHYVYTLWKYLKDKVKFEVWHIGNIGYINLPLIRSLSFYFKAKLKKSGDFDIVHIHNPKFAGLTNKAEKSIVTIHGDYEEFMLKYTRLAKPIIWYIEERLKNADAVTTVSPYWAKIRRWIWIPNMVELSEIEKIKPADERYLLFVGRDDPIKDYPLFRKIAEKVYEELKVKSLALGPLRHDTEFIQHMRVPWEKVISYMKSAYALVITSKHEGFPTTILEAWASGCPIVARKIPPIEELEKIHPKSMILAIPEKMAKVIIKLIRDGNLRSKLVKRGLEVVSNYDARIVTKRYYELYKKITSS